MKGRNEEERKSSRLVDGRGSQKPPSSVRCAALVVVRASKFREVAESRRGQEEDGTEGGRVIRRAETGNVLRNLQQSLDETIGHPRRNTGYAGSNNSSACCLLSPSTLLAFLSFPLFNVLSPWLSTIVAALISLFLFRSLCLFPLVTTPPTFSLGRVV